MTDKYPFLSLSLLPTQGVAVHVPSNMNFAVVSITLIIIIFNINVLSSHINLFLKSSRYHHH